MIKILLLAVVPFMTQHRNVAPKTVVSTNFYGSVTGIVNSAYIKSHGDGIDTNAVRNIVNEQLATNGIRSVDGAARPLPKYLHALDFDDSYPDAAEEYYRSRGNGKTDGGCSSVRSGGFLFRNFDYPFDDRAEFVVKMSAGKGRFASVGVAQVGTNLTEQIVTSGKWSKWYKVLPGAIVDGINEHGVVAEINVVDGDPQTSGWHTNATSYAIHPLAAIRWTLDHATNAQHAATFLAANIRFPAGWTQNFHFMIADETATYIVENGSAHIVDAASSPRAVMTNFRLYGDPKDTTGEGQERYIALTNGASITSQWWTLTYTAAGYRASDLPGITGEALTQLFNYWENNPRESHRGERFGTASWWQTIHTSIYDITNRVLRVAVQETDDWYTFQVPASGAKIDAYTKAETDEKLAGKIDGPTDATLTLSGRAADAQATGDAIGEKRGKLDLDVYNAEIHLADSFLPVVFVGHRLDDAYVLRQEGADFYVVSDNPSGVDIFARLDDEFKFIDGTTGITFRGRTLSEGDAVAVVEKAGEPSGDKIAKVSQLPKDYASVSNAAMGALSAKQPNGTGRIRWDYNSDGLLVVDTEDHPAWLYIDPDNNYMSAMGEIDANIVRADSEIYATEVYANKVGASIVERDGDEVVYGITVNGGERQHGNVDLWIPEENATTLRTMLVDANTNQTADCECISTNLCKLIAPELNRTVNANLNTYIDGDTGVEYVGKFYGGNLYYVPTGNVYPPNN